MYFQDLWEVFGSEFILLCVCLGMGGREARNNLWKEMPKKCAEHLTLNLTILKLVVWKTTTIFLTESFHPPAKEKRQLLKNPKKSNYNYSLHGLNQAHIWLQSPKVWAKKNLPQKVQSQKIWSQKNWPPKNLS